MLDTLSFEVKLILRVSSPLNKHDPVDFKAVKFAVRSRNMYAYNIFSKP